jgi:hypothetical protein
MKKEMHNAVIENISDTLNPYFKLSRYAPTTARCTSSFREPTYSRSCIALSFTAGEISLSRLKAARKVAPVTAAEIEMPERIPIVVHKNNPEVAIAMYELSRPAERLINVERSIIPVPKPLDYSLA